MGDAYGEEDKKTCAPPPTPAPPVPPPADDLRGFLGKVTTAASSLDFKGVLPWERRLEELMARVGGVGGSDDMRNYFLQVFANAHLNQMYNTNSKAHALDAVRLIECRIYLLSNMQRFLDQAACT